MKLKIKDKVEKSDIVEIFLVMDGDNMIDVKSIQNGETRIVATIYSNETISLYSGSGFKLNK